MANPTPLPITTTDTDQSSLTTTPAFRAFISRLTSSLRQGFSQRRPWYELVDRSALSRPDSVTDAVTRIRKNLTYFKVNYITLLALTIGFSLLSNPFSLILLLSLLAAWTFLYVFKAPDSPVVLFGRTFSDYETLGALIVLTIVVVFLTSVGSVLISALMIGFGIVCAHGAFRVPEDLFLDEQEPVNAGFLSFLGGAASSAAAAAAPAVASRV
ncbi:hypothetical protein ACFE04_030765 [Oxalis oulophora]